MRLTIYVILAVLACWRVGMVSAQPAEAAIRFAHIGSREGLSQSSVFSLYQDYLGFMWIGTRDGLNRYDARTFTTYRHNSSDSSSLSNSTILSLLEDSKKRLWVGTNAGLNRYDRTRDRFERLPLAHNQSGNVLSEPAVTGIVEDRQRRIWFATGQGLYCLDEQTDQLLLVFDVHRYSGRGISPSANNVQSFFEDDKGRIWLGTFNGALVFAPYVPGQPLRLLHHFPKAAGRLNDGNVRVVMQVSTDVFWLGTSEGGINVYDARRGSFSYLMHRPGTAGSLASNDVRSIIRDRFGGFWVGTLRGLSYYTEQGGFRTHVASALDMFSLSDNSIRPIFQDNRGSIWVGTYYGGVCVYDRHMPVFNNQVHSPLTSSLSYNIVSSILEDGAGNLWIGTEGGGLNYMDRQKRTFRHFKHQPDNTESLSHNNVKSLYLDSRGDLWVGTYSGGLNVMRKGRRTFEHFQHEVDGSHSLSHNNVYAIAEDATGNLWFGTYGGGLNLKKPGSDNFESYRVAKTGTYHLSSDLVRTVFVDSRDNLWVGTRDGLNLRRKGTDRFEEFRHVEGDAGSIGDDHVLSIFEDSQHRMWFGTYKNGLNLYLPESRSFRRFDQVDGLSNNPIFGILENEGQLWLSTNSGIRCFDPKSGSVKTYNSKDGIAGNAFSMGAACKTSEGKLIFGGLHGLTSFNPNDFMESNYVPPLVITDFRLFNKSVTPSRGGVLEKPIFITDTIQLNHEQSIFTIEFAAINYILAEKNKYAYRLKGLEAEWNYVDVPSATYTNLNPGTYTFMAKGASNDGVWNDIPTTLMIQVLPPPWKTWWAYLIYAALVGLAIYVIVRFTRIRSRLEHQLELEHLKNERQRELNEIKLNFFASISHEFRTPLTLILAPVQHILSHIKLEENTHAMMSTIKNNSQRLLHLVNQLLDFRKQETGNFQLAVGKHQLVEFMDRIAAEFQLFAEEQGIRFEYRKLSAPMEIWFDADQMEKVMYNLLSNAFKFVPGSGTVRLTLAEISPSSRYPEGGVAVQVWDNGRGIPEAKLDSIFEFFYQFNGGRNESGHNLGSGIGLALAKNLTELHGGELRVQSYHGSAQPTYTCFTVELPLGKEHIDPAQLTDNLLDVSSDVFIGEENYTAIPDFLEDFSPAATDGQLPATKPLLLIVEDNFEIRRMIAQHLQALYTIIEAPDGQEAWEVVKVQLPDLVITDIQMPVADGISLLRNMKGSVETNHIPVLLLTARTSTEHVLEGLHSGGDDYITKPFNLDVLSLKVRNILAARERVRKKFLRDYVLTPQEEIPAHSADQLFLQEVISRIEAGLAEPEFNVNNLARDLHISRPVLYRKLKQLTDLSVIEFIRVIRLRKAAQLLADGQLSVSQVAYQVGFSDPKYFGKTFKSFFGKSPTAYAADKDD